MVLSRLVSWTTTVAVWLITQNFSSSGISVMLADAFSPVMLTTSRTDVAFQPTLHATTSPNSVSVREIQRERERSVRSYHDTEAWNTLFVAVPERTTPVPYDTSAGGSHANDVAQNFRTARAAPLPTNFPPGCLLRLGPNGAPQNEGFFDGDGMVQCITFPPSTDREHVGMFSCSYVDTRGRQLEGERQKVFLGTLGAVPRGLPLLFNVLSNMLTFRTLQGQKDTCNTALATHGGRVLALMEQCPPAEIAIGRDGRISTVQANCNLDGAIPFAPITGGSLSAHGRTCPETGERVHVSYSSGNAPYVRVDTFAPDGWNLVRSVGVNVPCATMLHDCAITENYVVVLDFPLTLRTTRFLADQFPVEYEPSYGARIGLLPRHTTDADDSGTIWFDCAPGVILHLVNAYETNDGKVIVQGLRSEPSTSQGYLEAFSPSFLYEYELDLVSRRTSREGCLNPYEIVEFPILDESQNGKVAPHVYTIGVRSIGGPLATHQQPVIGLTLDSVVKFNLVNDTESSTKGDVLGKFVLPDRWFAVSEPTVVAKTDGTGGEYVLIIATVVPEGSDWKQVEALKPENADELTSHVLVLDGDKLDDGPVWMREMPHRIPYGLHSLFVPWELMK